jgi:surfactin synthase thioesterase subunit
MQEGIEVCPIQLPGRETRLHEKPCVSMDTLACQICDGIEPFCDLPFAFFGHSMGTMIALEVARELARRRHAMPQWLIMSGAVPPHRRKVESLHTLPMDEFISAVARRYNGLPREVLANRELLDLFAPILRADFELIEGYQSKATALGVKIAVVGGRGDGLTPPEELLVWRELTTQQDHFRQSLFDGDHFFLNECRHQLLAELVRLLQEIPERGT